MVVAIVIVGKVLLVDIIAIDLSISFNSRSCVANLCSKPRLWRSLLIGVETSSYRLGQLVVVCLFEVSSVWRRCVNFHGVPLSFLTLVSDTGEIRVIHTVILVSLKFSYPLQLVLITSSTLLLDLGLDLMLLDDHFMLPSSHGIFLFGLTLFVFYGQKLETTTHANKGY